MHLENCFSANLKHYKHSRKISSIAPKVLEPNTLKNKDDQFRKHWTEQIHFVQIVLLHSFYASSLTAATQPIFSRWGKHHL